MGKKDIIGIVGGLGPHAGVDLAKKVMDNTIASRDQEHLRLALLSFPEITCRNAFLAGRTKKNPGKAIAKKILLLEDLGATIAGIACNTAHAEKVFSETKRILRKNNSEIRVLHMIEEVAKALKKLRPKIKNVAVLSTTATYQHKVYSKPLKKAGFKVILPGLKFNTEFVNEAISNKKFGIKSQAGIHSKKAIKRLKHAVEWYKKQNTEAIILGCTELPLVADQLDFGKMIVLDSNEIMARALISAFAPEKLRPQKR